VEMQFVRSEEDMADLFKKYLGGEKFIFHSKRIFEVILQKVQCE
jgi:hypothetical protein